MLCHANIKRWMIKGVEEKKNAGRNQKTEDEKRDTEKKNQGIV